MADIGRLSTQYQRAYRAAAVIDRAAEELKATPVGRVEHNRSDLGRYLASVAGLIDPALAGEVDSELAKAVPRALVTSLGERRRADPELPRRLLETAESLKTGRKLESGQVELVQDVADVAMQDVLQLSREIHAY